MPKVQSKTVYSSKQSAMEVEDILHHIFGSDFSQRHTEARDFKYKLYLESISCWIGKTLNDLVVVEQAPAGKIGPPIVHFDVKTHTGLFMVAKDRLSASSQCNFGTIRANSCLYKGKWQYELNLSSNGVMQLGWATNNCKFSQEIGVGDTPNSYSYDGNRVRKWNVSTQDYGQPWHCGDVIGSTIDLDAGTIEFYRNGTPLGLAFSNVQLGPGMAYFPAVSLAHTEKLAANFGAIPFIFPVPGFEPLQEKPVKLMAQAEKLFDWVTQLLQLFEPQYQLSEMPSDQSGKLPSSQRAFVLGVASEVMVALTPLLSCPYITESHLLPFVEHLGHAPVGKMGSSSRLSSFLDLMWAFVEKRDMLACLESMMHCISVRYEQVSTDLEFSHQKRWLSLLSRLIGHQETRYFLLENILFEKVRFASLTFVEPLEASTLERLLPNPWFETTPPDSAFEHRKESYFRMAQVIKEAVSAVEILQVRLVTQLLDNSDGTATRPSSRKIMLKKLRNFLHQAITLHMGFPMLHTPHHISANMFYRILTALQTLWEVEVPSKAVTVPLRCFFDGSIEYFQIDRLGGVLSHLLKEHQQELALVLGADHPVFTPKAPEPRGPPQFLVLDNGTQTFVPAQNLQNFDGTGTAGLMIPIMTRLIGQPRPSSSPVLVDRFHLMPHRQEREPTRPGLLEGTSSLHELLDSLVLLYNTSVHTHLGKLRAVHAHVAKTTAAFDEVRLLIGAAKERKASAEAVSLLHKTAAVFEKELVNAARNLAWLRATELSAERQNALVFLMRVVLDSLDDASKAGALFTFVPDFYMEALIQLCSALRTYLPPSARMEDVEGHEQVTISVADFLATHFADPRIIHDDCKEWLIHALAGFVCAPQTLAALEAVPYKSRVQMVSALLRPYENRAWAQSNSILVRFWQGNGFAFRYHKSPRLSASTGMELQNTDSGLIFQEIKPCPSALFQAHVQEVMLANEPLTLAFINSLLNQLNWAFSEFIGLLQEFQNSAASPDSMHIDTRQRKVCATCFDLALALLRVLEMVTSIAPEIFTSGSKTSSELLLARICQLMSQVLNFVSSQTGCFQHMVQLQMPELDTVNHFPILAAVVGILLALLREDMDHFDPADEKSIATLPKVSKAILSEPNFQMHSLQFVVGDVQPTATAAKNPRIKTFSLNNYSQDVSAEEIALTRKMILMLEMYKSRLSAETVLSEEDQCSICYAFPISAMFLPCKHRSCLSCITHHLMNDKKCFFCKSPITAVVDLNGSPFQPPIKLAPENPE